MIITLKGAKFSKNIGTLTTWSIFTSLGSGATYSGVSLVDRGGAYSGTITLAEGYELGAEGVTVTMGGATLTEGITIDGSTITISITEVTGTVYITVPTVNTSTGEEDDGGNGDSGSDDSGGGDTTIEAGTHTYTNAGYVLQSNGALTGTSSTWIHSDFIPIDSLADNSEGICVGTFIGHGTVAAIAFYKTKDDYSSYTEGFILNSTSAAKTTQSAAEVKANITNNEAKYVVFSTDGSKATLEVTTA